MPVVKANRGDVSVTTRDDQSALHQQYTTNATPIVRSVRVQQTESIFDIPPAQKSEQTWRVPREIDDEPWQIGLIVGPSGAGKSTVARALYGDRVIEGFSWDPERAVVDGFPESMPIKKILGQLGAVGFNSPPAWLRPYSALSTGERFRVTVARALAEGGDLIVIDEFTSVVDRTVAQIASHTVAKAIRKTDRRFVAVSCHEDIIDWLQPDWIFEPAIDRLERRSLQRRPDVVLDVCDVGRDVWPLFRQHHYLSGELSPSAKVFGGFMSGKLIAISSYMHFPHALVRDIKMGHRLVVLPDYQGLGIGGALDDWLGEHLHEQGYRYHNVVTHPAMIHQYTKSPRWKLVDHGLKSPSGSKHKTRSLRTRHSKFSAVRASASFEYVPLPKGAA